MLFLNAIFLAGLPLLAIPIALHLLRRRQRQVVNWGAMQFLFESTTQKRNFQWLEDIPLLLLRTAAISALVLALSQPLLRGTWLGTTPTRELILVVDNSMSMARKSTSGTSMWDQLLERVDEILQSLTSNDSVRVLLASQGAHWLTNEWTAVDADFRERLLDQLHELRSTEGAADFADCVQLAFSLEPSREAQQRDVIVLTDGQQHGWMADDSVVWDRLAALKAEASKKVSTTLHVVLCGESAQEVNNCAVTRITTEQTVVATGEMTKLTAEIRNTGNTPVKASTAQWICGGEAVATVDTPLLEAGQTHTVDLAHTFKETGVRLCSCRFTHPDDMESDNQSTIVIEVVDQIPILYVWNGAAGQEIDEATWFFQAALGYGSPSGAQHRWQSIYRPKIVTPAEFSNTRLTDYSAVFLSNVTELNTATMERLRDFVFAGGGLWVTLGPRTNPTTFNSTWYNQGAGLSPLSVQQLIKCPQGQENATRFRIHAPGTDHLATVNLADTSRLDVDQVRMAQYFQLAPPSDETTSVLLSNGMGQPLAAERYVGRGRVILQAFPFDTDWSNWPTLKSFIVTVNDWLAYLSVPSRTQYNLAPGSLVALSPPSDIIFTTARITTPMLSTAVPLLARENELGQIYRYSQTEYPGTYNVEFVHSAKPILTVPFNVSRATAESNLEPLTAEQRARLEESLGFQVTHAYNPSVPSANPVTSTPRQAPMWWTLLVVVLGLLLLESVVSSRRSRTLDTATSPSFPSMLKTPTGEVRETISI